MLLRRVSEPCGGCWPGQQHKQYQPQLACVEQCQTRPLLSLRARREILRASRGSSAVAGADPLIHHLRPSHARAPKPAALGRRSLLTARTISTARLSRAKGKLHSPWPCSAHLLHWPSCNGRRRFARHSGKFVPVRTHCTSASANSNSRNANSSRATVTTTSSTNNNRSSTNSSSSVANSTATTEKRRKPPRRGKGKPRIKPKDRKSNQPKHRQGWTKATMRPANARTCIACRGIFAREELIRVTRVANPPAGQPPQVSNPRLVWCWFGLVPCMHVLLFRCGIERWSMSGSPSNEKLDACSGCRALQGH